MPTVSSNAIGNALGATCHYQQEAHDKSIGTCANNRAVISTQVTVKILLTRLYYKVYFMLSSKIDIINRNILMLLYLMHAVSEVSSLDSI